MATLLLDAGADPNAKTADGHTPLHLAAFQDMVELLVGRGAEIDARANDGNTPLLVQAAEAEGIEIMEALLEAGADANARDQHGETAMRIAADREEDDKVKLRKRRATPPRFAPLFGHTLCSLGLSEAIQSLK